MLSTYKRIVKVHDNLQFLGKYSNVFTKNAKFKKNVNLSYGCFYNKNLVAYLICNLIFIEKISEYEILVIYVKKTYLRKGLANYLLSSIYIQKN